MARHRPDAGHLRELFDMQMAAMREHFELRLVELEKRIGGERALLVAANVERQQEMERRLAALNELRGEVLADRALFVTRDAFEIVAGRIPTFLVREYYDEQHHALAEKVETATASLADKVDLNTTAISNIRSRAAAYAAGMGLAITVLTAIVIIIQLAH